MSVLPLELSSTSRPDPIDPGIVHVLASGAPGLIQRGDSIKAWIQEHAFSKRARRAAVWLDPDAILNLHDVVDQSLAQPLPAGEEGTAAFKAIFTTRSVPEAIVDALAAARALFFAETGYWPKKILSRCHTPLYGDEEFHIVNHAHFDSYADPDERFVMIVTLSGNGPVLIRNPASETPPSTEREAFAAYAEELRRRYGEVRVGPGTIVMKKANHRGAATYFDLLPHRSGKVSHWPLLGKRVAFTLS